MENSTPLTRCDTCHTVFEVPSSILDSVDSRVRCGECLQVFDASINLHTASRPDFSLVDQTLVDGTDSEKSKSAEIAGARQPEQKTENAAVPDLAAITAASVDDKLTTTTVATAKSLPAAIDAPPDRLSDGIVSGRMNGRDSARHDDTADESHLEATLSDFDLFSDDASLPEVSQEFGENTIDAIRLQFDSVDDVADETLSDSLFPNEVTIDASGLDVGRESKTGAADLTSNAVTTEISTIENAKNAASADKPEDGVDEVLKRSAKTDFVVDEGPRPEIVEFDFSEKATRPTGAATTPGASREIAGTSTEADSTAATQAMTPASSETVPGAAGTESMNPVLADTPAERTPSRLGRHLLHASFLLLTVILVAALYGYRERHNLVDNPLTRPFYSAWCNIKGCPVPARFDKTQLKVVEKNIFSHPTLDDALVITVLLENNADFEQRYPALFLWLSDSARRTVASNEFEPAVYLPENGLTVESVLAPGQQRRISIDVRDPGRRAVSLELSLR